MIVLSEELLIGEGGERYCYSLPGDPKCCVKVTKPGLSGRLEQSVVEYDYYRILKRRKVPLDHLPDCYGWIETNFGEGLVYERVVSKPEESLSVTLREALKNNLITIDKMYEALDELRFFLLKYDVATSDLCMNNLIVDLYGDIKFYLVDGVGGRNFDFKYKLRKRLPFYGKYKVKQQWPMLLNEIKRELNTIA